MFVTHYNLTPTVKYLNGTNELILFPDHTVLLLLNGTLHLDTACIITDWSQRVLNSPYFSPSSSIFWMRWKGLLTAGLCSCSVCSNSTTHFCVWSSFAAHWILESLSNRKLVIKTKIVATVYEKSEPNTLAACQIFFAYFKIWTYCEGKQIEDFVI